MSMGCLFQVDGFRKQLPAHIHISSRNLAGASKVSLGPGHRRQVGVLFKIAEQIFSVFTLGHFLFLLLYRSREANPGPPGVIPFINQATRLTRARPSNLFFTFGRPAATAGWKARWKA